MITEPNKYMVSDFEDYLAKEGLLESATATTVNNIADWQDRRQSKFEYTGKPHEQKK